MTTKRTNDHQCCVCQASIIGDKDAKKFQINNKSIFVCAQHNPAFTMGFVLGGQALNVNIVALTQRLSSGSIDGKEFYRLLKCVFPQIVKNDDGVETNIISPSEVYRHLNQYVIGQEEAKRRISMAAFEHFSSIGDTREAHKNVLLIGPSGSGKTLIAKNLATVCKSPFVITDATEYTPNGYRGTDVDSMILRLYEKSNKNIQKASEGIIFVDEIDKLTSRYSSHESQHDGFLMSTQSAMLKLIEGKSVSVEQDRQEETLNTDKMLFLFGGAFHDLPSIIAKKMGHSPRSIGFGKSQTSSKIDEAMRTYEIILGAPHDVLIDSLIEIGLISELVGRIPVVAPLAPLTKEELMDCLALPSSPIFYYQKLFAQHDLDLRFTPELLQNIIDSAYKSATGARTLTTLVNRSVSSAAFNTIGQVSQGTVTLTASCITDPDTYEISSSQLEVEVPFLKANESNA